MGKPNDEKLRHATHTGAGYVENAGMPESTPIKRLYDGATLALIILISYTVYSAYLKLPEHFPAHFGLAGQPDGFGDRTSIVVLAALAGAINLTFYILIRYLGRNPRYLSIPHKEKFLKLPEQKQMKYRALISEFMAGTLAGLNLLMYLTLRGITLVAMGEETFLPFMYIWPAMGILWIFLIFYIVRIVRLPGKLIRGEI